jgi:hypothetical protein
MGAVHRAPADYPSGKAGGVLTVEFTVEGLPCIGLNGGPVFRHNEAFSSQIATGNQAETDRLWYAVVGNGGQESACGWCKEAGTNPDVLGVRPAAKRWIERSGKISAKAATRPGRSSSLASLRQDANRSIDGHRLWPDNRAVALAWPRARSDLSPRKSTAERGYALGVSCVDVRLD